MIIGGVDPHCMPRTGDHKGSPERGKRFIRHRQMIHRQMLLHLYLSHITTCVAVCYRFVQHRYGAIINEMGAHVGAALPTSSMCDPAHSPVN